MPSRSLTAGEIALAKRVFGSSIDYTAVGVSDSKFMGLHPRGVAMSPDGNLYMHGCYKDDYAAGSTYEQSFFLHEMTHVWQYQNKVLNPIAEALKLSLQHKFNYEASYFYTLDAKKDLLDYNMEQQASIVQDYFSLKETGSASPWTRCQNGTAGQEALYESVLKNFLADPGYAAAKAAPAQPRKPKPPKK
jgi:hypothetical protein